jgi:hypothetical protein
MSVREQPVLRSRATTRPDHLVLLQEDLDLQLEHLVLELIRAGHSLLIEGQDSWDPASFTLGDGLRLCGDAGVLNSRTVREVVGCSIRNADDVFELDLGRLDHLALLSWAAVLQATQGFRSSGGVLRVHARGGTRRLLAMPTVIECDRRNLELT